MSNVIDRAKYYDGLVHDLEVEALALTLRARRLHALPDVCHNAAARRAGEAGFYSRKADELRDIAA